MAVFNKNSLYQISGFDNPIIAGELVTNQKTFWNLTMEASDGTPINLTGATIDASIIRRQLSNVQDTRYGLTFDISDYIISVPTAISLTISNRVDATGKFTLTIDSAWSLITTDTQLDISAVNPAGFSGRIKISFPASGSTPAQDSIVFLLFLVRSDGVTN